MEFTNIKIIETETTKKCPIVSTLIGTQWRGMLLKNGEIMIDACDGLILQKGEYEEVISY